MDTTEKHSKAKTIWLLVVLFLFAVSNTVWGLLYIKQHSDKQQIDSQVASLTSEKSNLTSKVKTLESTQSETPAENKTTTDTTWREIPELGVKYKTNDDLKNITYAYEHSQYIRLSTYTPDDTISALEWSEACGKPLTPAGTITKWKQGATYTFEGDGRVVDTIPEAKKLGNYYYVYEGVQPTQRTSCQGDSAKKAGTIGKQLFESLETI